MLLGLRCDESVPHEETRNANWPDRPPPPMDPARRPVVPRVPLPAIRDPGARPRGAGQVAVAVRAGAVRCLAPVGRRVAGGRRSAGARVHREARSIPGRQHGRAGRLAGELRRLLEPPGHVGLDAGQGQGHGPSGGLEDVPGGASAYILQKIVEEQNAYRFLDSEPQTLSAKEHRPPYGKDGDYFTKPSAEDVFEKVYKMMNEVNPEKFPSLY